MHRVRRATASRNRVIQQRQNTIVEKPFGQERTRDKHCSHCFQKATAFLKLSPLCMRMGSLRCCCAPLPSASERRPPLSKINRFASKTPPAPDGSTVVAVLAVAVAPRPSGRGDRAGLEAAAAKALSSAMADGLSPRGRRTA